ncbi:MAG: hypothetical protein A2W07_06885 [candidate division Zixibacteria bacterium RBG_16_43_9]|nr:MAG: hypothetical protein A2W07_06885 [candidate division Zixibacteria bacterium RBG_16_43_9]
MIAFFKGKGRYAIDPLNEFFEKNPVLMKSRDKEVKYFQGYGESLPFREGYFSLVIIDNVLDHTQSPQDVLKETMRVLAPGGFLYLMVNVHTSLGFAVRCLMEMFQIDKGHPHSYTRDGVRRFLENIGFEVCDEELEDYMKSRRSELKSGYLKNKLKVMLGISDIQYEVLAKRR